MHGKLRDKNDEKPDKWVTIKEDLPIGGPQRGGWESYSTDLKSESEPG